MLEACSSGIKTISYWGACVAVSIKIMIAKVDFVVIPRTGRTVKARFLLRMDGMYLAWVSVGCLPSAVRLLCGVEEISCSAEYVKKSDLELECSPSES